MKTIHLPDVIAGVHSMLRRMLPASIEISRRDGPEVWCVRADRGHIEQVVMNLAINARDAMPDGGRLDISLSNETVNEGFARAPPGDYVALRVSDTGTGMDRAVLERIFEPFFTTKERRRGSGLGLAICYGIVAQAGGHIWATSAPGAGSTFTVLLPRSLSPAPDLAPSAPAASAAVGGAERILVVEDDQAVMRATTQILQLAGYDVTSAENGEDALDLLRQDVDRFDLILSDVDMPLMGGPELANALHALRPELPILLMSGFSHHSIDRQDEGNRIGDRPMLMKPFDRRTLLGFVRDGLDQAQRALAASSS